MDALSVPDQTVRVGGETRRLFLKQETSDPDVRMVSLRTVATTLRAALRNLKKLARDLEKPKPVKRRAFRALDAPERPVWSLALDEIRGTGFNLRPSSRHEADSAPLWRKEPWRRAAGETAMSEIGPTGEYPEGKLTPKDEGELAVRVRHLPGKVLLEFGASVKWIGMDPGQARGVAELLRLHADEAERIIS